MKVKLTVYKNVLVIETVEPEKTDYPGWVPVGPGKIGCVLCDTKRGLGASKEALDWLKGVKRCHDDIGDVDWFAVNDGTKAFGWIGGLCSLKCQDCEGARNFQVYPEDCTIIPNDVPEGAKRVIEEKSSE